MTSRFERVDRPGSRSIGGIDILGLPTFHDEVQGRKQGPNTVFRLSAEGVSICHCGDLGHRLSEEQLEALERIDVLLVPVGGRFAIDAAQADRLRRRLRPSVTIPMHYRTRAMGLAGLLFAPVERFLAVAGEEPRRERELTLEASGLGSPGGIVVMEYR